MPAAVNHGSLSNEPTWNRGLPSSRVDATRYIRKDVIAPGRALHFTKHLLLEAPNYRISRDDQRESARDIGADRRNEEFRENLTRGRHQSPTKTPDAYNFPFDLCSRGDAGSNVANDLGGNDLNLLFLSQPTEMSIDESQKLKVHNADSLTYCPEESSSYVRHAEDVIGAVMNNVQKQEIQRNECFQLLHCHPESYSLALEDEGVGFLPEMAWERLSVEEALGNMEEVYLADNYVEKCICLFQKCRRRKCYTDSAAAYAHICKNGMECHGLFGSYLISMFLESGRLCMAQQVFNKTSYHNEYAWTSLIQGYIEGGDPEHGLNLFFRMIKTGIQPSKYTYVAVLEACARLKSFQRGCQIHEEIIKEGFEKELFVARSLVDFYAKCYVLTEAQSLFEELPEPDTNLWTTSDARAESLDMYTDDDMLAVAAVFIYNLKACGSIKDANKGHKLHIQIVKVGLDTYHTVCNTLIDMYGKCHLISEAVSVLRRMICRDVISWTALIAGCVEHGRGAEALKYFEKMQEDNISPNSFTYVSCLKACSIIQSRDTGRKIHTAIMKEGCYMDFVVTNSLVDMYAKCASLEEAQNVFDKLTIQDTIGWTSLIAGYAEHGPSEKAIECFQQMQVEGVAPTTVTFVCCLKACASMQDLHSGRKLHSEVLKEGFEEYKFVGNALLSMYARCGMYTEARSVLHQLAGRDVISWTTLIGEYAEDGLGEEALDALREMLNEGFVPNSITYACCLKACGSVGGLKKGQRLHMDITKRGYEKNSFIHSALIDMYAECGKPLGIDLDNCLDTL